MRYFLLMLLIIGTGCERKGTPVATEMTNDRYNVVLLFKSEGCSVYRFADGGRAHYFTNCTETMTTQKSGKTYFNESIKGN